MDNVSDEIVLSRSVLAKREMRKRKMNKEECLTAYGKRFKKIGIETENLRSQFLDELETYEETDFPEFHLEQSSERINSVFHSSHSIWQIVMCIPLLICFLCSLYGFMHS